MASTIANQPDHEPALHRRQFGFTNEPLIEPSDLLVELLQFFGADAGIMAASESPGGNLD
jgi:hypothetical protein